MQLPLLPVHILLQCVKYISDMVTYTSLALVHLWVHITVSNQNYVNSISGVANAYKYLFVFFSYILGI